MSWAANGPPDRARWRAKRRVGPADLGEAVIRSVSLAVAVGISYSLVTHVLARIHAVSSSDSIIGGLWAVIATVFVYRDTYEQSLTAALSRVSATSVSFSLCLVYLLIFPFQVWGMAALIGIGALVVMLLGRPGDIITTEIATAVVLVAAAVSPHNAWEQPILRMVDTIAGIAVGMAAAWISLRATDLFGRQRSVDAISSPRKLVQS